jgi:hypothetical protein
MRQCGMPKRCILIGTYGLWALSQGAGGPDQFKGEDDLFQQNI